MSWRQSSGRDGCNHCRKTIQLGAPVYVGPITGAKWCEGCAAERLGQFVDGKSLPIHAEPMVGLDDAGAETLRGLRERFAPKVRPTWGRTR